MTDVRCTGCGSSMTDDELAFEKSKHPTVLSCCPERKMLDITGWMARAIMFEAQVSRRDAELERRDEKAIQLSGQLASARKALEGIAEFSSSDATTLGAISRLTHIRNTVQQQLLSLTDEKGQQ